MGSGSPGVAIFVGGGKNYYTPIANVQTYDTSLTKGSSTALTVSRLSTCVINLNNKHFLIGGGCTGYDFGDEDTEGRNTYDGKVYVYNIE